MNDDTITAAHRPTPSIRDRANLRRAARALMRKDWSKFTEQDVRLYCLHLDDAAKVYEQFYGGLRGAVPLQVTMYSGPRIVAGGDLSERTWVEWTGRSIACWNAVPLDPLVGGEYTWQLVSRLERRGAVPEPLATVARHITHHHIYLAGRPSKGERPWPTPR